MRASQIAPTKTSINLLSRTSLGGAAVDKNAVRLSIVLTRRLEHDRVLGVLQISPRSFVHRFKLTSPDDVDAEFQGWLKESDEVGMMAGRRIR